MVVHGADALTKRCEKITVEIDNELLSRLRERSPGKSDREALERAARIQLGFETIRRAQERSAAAGVDEDEVMAEAVRGVRESRRSRLRGERPKATLMERSSGSQNRAPY
jgi:hypothetical protein